jgi:inner membrane protein
MDIVQLHILYFLIGIFLISLFIEKNFRDYSISTILFFLFYLILFLIWLLYGYSIILSFIKNPCVLPANPEMRIRSGNIRQEGIILFMFCFLTFFMQDLFAMVLVHNQ